MTRNDGGRSLSSPPDQGQWKESLPPDRAWKGRPGRDKAACVAEQDRAAGGRRHRFLDLGDGRYARASITLKLYSRTRRIRAYLRWSENGRSPEKYVGEVDRETRAENLAQAWKMVAEKGLLAKRSLPPESWASSPEVRSVMRANRGRDTKPELRIRSILHRQGFRYRVSSRPLPNLRRTADLVFRKSLVAVFIDGCFWHGCPEHLRQAKRNSEFWVSKIEGNRKRDRETDQSLTEAGWSVLRIWEHEDPEEAALRIAELVRARNPQRFR